jgi:hypothetical protein
MSTETMSAQPTGDTTPTEETAAERCGQCGAAAAPEQRYCLNCGFHRRNARDPVARYLSEASAARTRVAAAAALAAQRRRTPRFGPRITATLVAVTLLVGILIGSAIGGGSVAPKATSSAGSAKSTTTAKKHKSPAKNATGSSYLNQENNLPNSVTP